MNLTEVEALKCPECSSERLYRDGVRDASKGPIQRFLCRRCGFRFSDPNGKPLKECQTNDNRQICAILQDAKNLTTATETKTVAGEERNTTPGRIVEYAWKMKKRGLCDITIHNRAVMLQLLVRKGADLNNPDSVETVLATEKLSTSMKSSIVASYRSFTKTFEISWTPIRVHYQPKQPFIPLESELSQLVAACGKRTATFLQVLKDTACRAGEACKLKWTDINEANSTISINNPEKGSNTRTIKVSAKTVAMSKAMPKKYGEYVFNPKLTSIEDTFTTTRNRLARTLQNPRIRQIHLHTFRHWKATVEYAKTKDILHVMRMLGHKNIQNTLIYTHLIEFENDDYYSATANTVNEARKLVESGFEYVCEVQNAKIFRKRK